jgi:hypothetical protein
VLVTVVQAVVYAAYPFVRAFGEFVTLAVVASLAEVGGSPLRAGYLSLIAGLGQLGWALLGLMYAGLALGLSAAAHSGPAARCPAARETAAQTWG